MSGTVEQRAHDMRNDLRRVVVRAEAVADSLTGSSTHTRAVVRELALSVTGLAEVVMGLLPVDARPGAWPPKPGDVWQDRDGDRWIGTAQYPLICIVGGAARIAMRGSAEDVWHHYGPMTFVARIEPCDDEVPF